VLEKALEKSSLRVPSTARRSNQSTLKEINPEYSLEELMLKLQYFSHVKSNSLEKPLMLGKIEGRRRRGQQRMRWFEQILGDSEGQGSLTCFMTTVHVVTKNQTQLSNWTTKTRHERSHIVSFYLYELHSLGRSLDPELRLVVKGQQGGGNGEQPLNMTVSLWVGENGLNLNRGGSHTAL